MLVSLDPAALEEHRRYLYRYAIQQVRDAEAANDLVQDTLVAALENGDRFQGRSAVRTWLVGVLKHKIADSFRHRARAPVSLDALADTDWRDEAGRRRGTPRRRRAGRPGTGERRGAARASGRRARRASTACRRRPRGRSS